MDSLHAEIQWGIVQVRSQGMTQGDIARLFRTSRDTVRDICTYFTMFNVVPADHKTQPQPRTMCDLTDAELGFLHSLMQAQPDLYLDEYCAKLAEVYNVSICLSSMHRVLAGFNATYKVLYRASAQADPYLEAQFLQEVAHLGREMFVWGDEMGTNRNDAVHRRRGRALLGERAVDRGYMLERKHYSCLAFMTVDGILTHFTCTGAIKTLSSRR